MTLSNIQAFKVIYFVIRILYDKIFYLGKLEAIYYWKRLSFNVLMADHYGLIFIDRRSNFLIHMRQALSQKNLAKFYLGSKYYQLVLPLSQIPLL